MSKNPIDYLLHIRDEASYIISVSNDKLTKENLMSNQRITKLTLFRKSKFHFESLQQDLITAILKILSYRIAQYNLSDNQYLREIALKI